jgi:hypothetical protein
MSRESKFSALLWKKTAHAFLAIAAIELGVWAGLELSPHPTPSTTLVAQRFGHTSSRGVKDIGADAQLRSDCARIRMVESDGNSFAVLAERFGHEKSATASGVGSADVFDQSGLLVRHYTAIEHADHSCELMELIRVTPDSAGPVDNQR